MMSSLREDIDNEGRDDKTEGQREAEMPTRQDVVGLGLGLRNVKCYQTSTWPRQGAVRWMGPALNQRRTQNTSANSWG
jgi:hypothetical protein